MKIALIGGSGLSSLDGLSAVRRQVVRTPWGEPSGPLVFGQLGGNELVFLARHGYGHTKAPHEINYRANLWALQSAGVEGVIAVATVGGVRADLAPGSLLVPDQIIDYTWGRGATFFEGPGQPVTHVDFTEPFDRALREALLAAGLRCGLSLVDGGCYGCTQGPRLESAAEIRRLARDGCDVVGMTAMPEAALARELGLPYAAINLVVNSAAGVGDSARHISMAQMREISASGMAQVHRVLGALLGLLVARG